MLSKTRGSLASASAPALIPGPSAGPVSTPAATEFDPTAARGNHVTATDPKTLPVEPGSALARFEQQLAAAGIPERTWVCPTCEHVLRVSGLGRHRVYFELTDELLDDPVMDRVCPGCGHGLPGKNPAFPSQTCTPGGKSDAPSHTLAAAVVT